MQLVTYGISFHNATLPQREPLAFSDAQQRHVLSAVQNSGPAHEGLVLCTCNRTEFYLYIGDDFDANALIHRLIEQVSPQALELWKTHSYAKTGLEAVRHLFTVAAGLDSQMIGESQIIRQIKDAYTLAIECRIARFFFHRLTHCAFRASKAVRTQTDINTGAVSISSAAVELAREKTDLARARVLMIGAGENAALTAEYLVLAGVQKLTVASRSLESANSLVSHLTAGIPTTLSNMHEELTQADLVLCSTASETPVLTAGEHGYLLSQRRTPVTMIDIAVPRDVEPVLGEIEGVSLYNIEDLNQQVERNLKNRSLQVPAAMQVIDQHVQAFDQWLKSLDVADVISAICEEYQQLARSEADRYCRLFPDVDTQQFRKFSESLVSKVLHGPIRYLKNAGRDELASEQLETIEIIKKMLLEIDRKRGTQ
jgi:glutamyl-tRNA reductase